ncbi:serine hydrolase domain-containing protein [Streptomyces sp. NPDC001339]|uniref:serine hydrolase domain-containing protein n=1 Tax=Streptomyces sp. NPDC001339 TaxID=3364563 RepID=UPI00368A8371
MTKSLPVPASTPRLLRAHATRAGIGLLVPAIALMGCAEASGAPASHDVKPMASNVSLTAHPGHARVQHALDQAVAKGGVPGMIAEVRNGRDAWFGSAGVADIKTGRKRQPQERFRIGSAAKAFTSTVVLQLAGEHKLSLDDTVDKWLPGLVRGHGNDGRKITIRQLLNHTSGLFNYGNDEKLFPLFKGEAFLKHRFDTFRPEDLVKVGISNPPYFAPGKGFRYSNTGYFLAGMIAEKVTGHPLTDEIRRRIVVPLGLKGTYLPGEDTAIRGPHPRHYSTLFETAPHAKVYDVTEQNTSYAWAAGGVVSTAGDLHRFVGALLNGRLLKPAQQREMFTTVSTKGSGWIPKFKARYGLGVFSHELPCGRKVWGIGGAISGGYTWAMGTRDGKHMMVSNMNGDWNEPLDALWNVYRAEFCPAGSPAPKSASPSAATH